MQNKLLLFFINYKTVTELETNNNVRAKLKCQETT